MLKKLLSNIDAKVVRRFGYYLVGLSIGSIGLVFINRQKGNSFDYGPNARTLKQIRLRKEFIIEPEAQKTINQHGIDSLRIQYILHKGDVDFGKSNPRIKPCPDYWIDATLRFGEKENPIYKDVAFVVKRCDSTAYLQKVIVK